MHGFAIDKDGCEKQNRMPHSPGNDPCTELETRAGIWRYYANKTNQVFSPKERYATGIRNGEGFDFDNSGRLYVTQHGPRPDCMKIGRGSTPRSRVGTFPRRKS